MRYIYLDHAATTPVAQEVLQQMLPFFSEIAGNPSSSYCLGRAAKLALENARAQVANAIGAEPGEIYFTSGGSESDNWAIKGIAQSGGRKHIITTAIEHHAVLNACCSMEKFGFRVTRLPVDSDGLVSPKDLEAAITEDTCLISVMAANNEIGTIQPIQEIGEIAKHYKIPFHTDAVQAIGAIPICVDEWNVDLLSLSAHKFYGPKGVGALYVRRGIIPDNLIHGGAQERSRRGGTENVPGIVGLGYAIETVARQICARSEHISRLRDVLIAGVLRTVPGSRLNGHPEKRLAGNAHFSFPDVDRDLLLKQLELRGILVAAGAACSSGQTEPSHVLKALGLPWRELIGAIRFTLGYETTEAEIQTVLSALPAAIRDARSIQFL